MADRYGRRVTTNASYDRAKMCALVARYLLNNPVRAGLVMSPIDYPYLGSDRWSVTELIDALQ